MASTEFLPHWPFLLGLVLLLVVSAGIWYNLNGIAKRFPQLISSPQRWLAGFAVALLASSVGILGYQVISQNLGTDGLIGLTALELHRSRWDQWDLVRHQPAFTARTFLQRTRENS